MPVRNILESIDKRCSSGSSKLLIFLSFEGRLRTFYFESQASIFPTPIQNHDSRFSRCFWAQDCLSFIFLSCGWKVYNKAPDRCEPWIFAENICRGNFFQGILFSVSACARFSTSFPYNFHRKLWSLKANRNTINEIIQSNCGSKNCDIFIAFSKKIFWNWKMEKYWIDLLISKHNGILHISKYSKLPIGVFTEFAKRFHLFSKFKVGRSPRNLCILLLFTFQKHPKFWRENSSLGKLKLIIFAFVCEMSQKLKCCGIREKMSTFKKLDICK